MIKICATCILARTCFRDPDFCLRRRKAKCLRLRYGHTHTEIMNNRVMRLGLHYRLRKSASALYQENGKTLCLHLAPGSLVQLAGSADEQGRLIEVLYEGRQLMMFVEDVLRGDLLDSETPKLDGDLGLGTVQ